MKIAVAQINTTVGDFEGNAEKVFEYLDMAVSAKASAVVFPELTVCGYPPKDLLEKPSFIDKNLETVEKIASITKDTAVILGFVSRNDSKIGRPLHNSVGILKNGKVRFVQHKTLLPEYDVFDEVRYFEPAKTHNIYQLENKKVGLTACEDMWSFHNFEGRRLYQNDPTSILAKAGCEVLISLSASPFTLGKQAIRRELLSRASRLNKVVSIYCNQVGGNDELVFDGKSFVCDSKGRIIYEGRAFAEDFFVVDTDDLKPVGALPEMKTEEEIKRALVLGLSDYMKKCGFKKAVIGISGGLDSAVVATIACEAVGAENVTGVMMPSPYTSKESVRDAKDLASALGMELVDISISDAYEVHRKTLGLANAPDALSLVEENLQARIRGNILMALSNKYGALVISTGNKSELSVGYCTLYGDMVGGFALISDIPKTLVYELARHLRKIPQSIIDKPPSAELRPGQTDQDSLPPYEDLDPIIAMYIEERRSLKDIISRGYSETLVAKVVEMIEKNEYKRRQAAPGIKITSKAFGTGRRFPIARKYI
jgi:NAD+ synthetase